MNPTASYQTQRVSVDRKLDLKSRQKCFSRQGPFVKFPYQIYDLLLGDMLLNAIKL